MPFPFNSLIDSLKRRLLLLFRSMISNSLLRPTQTQGSHPKEVYPAESSFWPVFTGMVQTDYSNQMKSSPSSQSLLPDASTLNPGSNSRCKRCIMSPVGKCTAARVRERSIPPTTSSPSPRKGHTPGRRGAGFEKI